jgi:hypothetical protein
MGATQSLTHFWHGEVILRTTIAYCAGVVTYFLLLEVSYEKVSDPIAFLPG